MLINCLNCFSTVHLAPVGTDCWHQLSRWPDKSNSPMEFDLICSAESIQSLQIDLPTKSFMPTS